MLLQQNIIKLLHHTVYAQLFLILRLTLQKVDKDNEKLISTQVTQRNQIKYSLIRTEEQEEPEQNIKHKVHQTRSKKAKADEEPVEVKVYQTRSKKERKNVSYKVCMKGVV